MFLLALVLGFSTASYAITNSVPAEETAFNAVVMIKVDARDENGEDVPGNCNATIVSDRRLVTAAHCVAHAWLLRSKNLDIEIGRYKYRNDANGRPVRIGYAIMHRVSDTNANFVIPATVEAKLRRQGFNARIEPNEDNATLELSVPLDLAALEVTPMAIATRDEVAEARQQGASFLAVSVNPVAYISTSDFKRKATFDRITWKTGSLESRSAARVEPLDSGSPLFTNVRGQWKVFAVVKGAAKSLFGEWDMFSLLPN